MEYPEKRRLSYLRSGVRGIVKGREGVVGDRNGECE